MIDAIVVGQGLFYADGTERLYIHINKYLNHGLPATEVQVNFNHKEKL